MWTVQNVFVLLVLYIVLLLSYIEESDSSETSVNLNDSVDSVYHTSFIKAEKLTTKKKKRN